METLYAAAKSLQSCPTLCDPVDGSPPGSPIPGILQARTLEWVCHFLLQCMKVESESEVTQSCLTLSSPMDCSLPGSSVHGIFQARVLEWGAIAFSITYGISPTFGIRQLEITVDAKVEFTKSTLQLFGLLLFGRSTQW